MNILDRLRDIYKKRIKKGWEYIEYAQRINKHITDVQRQIEADEISLRFIDSLPEELACEFAPRWLQREEKNNAYFEQIMPSFSNINNFDRLNELQITTSGTVYIYASSIYEMETDSNIGYVDLSKAKFILENYQQNLIREGYLQYRLELINKGLGEAFNIAIDSFNKCKAELVGIDQVAIQLRNTLDQAWGGLCEQARSKNNDPRRNTNNLQLKKDNDRELVADILADHRISKDELVCLLSDMYKLYSSLSALSKRKTPNDYKNLDDCYNQWIAILDRISVLVI